MKIVMIIIEEYKAERAKRQKTGNLRMKKSCHFLQFDAM